MELKLGRYEHYKGNYYEALGVGRIGRSIGTDGLFGVANFSEEATKEIYLFRRNGSFILEGDLPSGVEFCIYKQLYDSPDGKHKIGDLWIRPLEMFLQTVSVDGKEVQRFKYLGNGNEQGTG